MLLRFGLTFCFLITWVSVNAQLKVYHAEIYEESVLKESVFLIDSFQMEALIQKHINKLVSKNYLLASLDSTVLKNDTFKYYVFKGQALNWVKITGVNKEEDRLFNKIKGKKVNTEKFKSVLEKTISNYANNGYPFAHIKLIDANLQQQGVVCQVIIDKGPLVTYDTVIFFGDVKISKAFVKHFLGIESGNIYSERVVNNLNGKIRALNNVEIEQKPLVTFRKNRATIILRLKEVQANKIDALVGFAPESGNNSNKLLLTGQADIALVNLTGNREEIGLDWQSFLKNSQSLKTRLYLPFIPYLNLGTTLNFGLVKFDSNYLQTKGGVAVNLLSGNNFKWSVFYNSEVTSLLTADTSSIRATFNFPSINATTLKSYGVSIEKAKWENRINPWKGYSFNFTSSAGIKRIKRDNRIERVQFNESGRKFTLYDSLKLSFNQFETSIQVDFAVPLSAQKLIIYSKVSASSIWADKIFFGELYRLGGFKTLKGFDEQSIFANQFLAGTIELRYRFNTLSNAFIFSNAMYYKNKSENFQGIKEDIPIGFGVGANINTGNTVLSIAYGYGIQKNIPLNLSQGKFHFGLVSYF